MMIGCFCELPNGLLQGIVGRHYLRSYRKGWSSVAYAEGDMKEIKEALKHLSLADLSWLPIRYFGVINSVRNSLKQKRQFECIASVPFIVKAPFLLAYRPSIIVLVCQFF